MEIPAIDTFLDYFENVRGRTLRVAERIPADQLEWRPFEDFFSCGDLVRHIAATERYLWAENVRGGPSRYPGHGPELADGLPAVLEYLRRCHEEAVAIFRGLGEAELLRPCPTPAGATLPTWKWLRALVEHEVHHRGQLYLMLHLLGVATPPLYGLTEPQVRANSIPAGDAA